MRYFLKTNTTEIYLKEFYIITSTDCWILPEVSVLKRVSNKSKNLRMICKDFRRRKIIIEDFFLEKEKEIFLLIKKFESIFSIDCWVFPEIDIIE